MMYMNQKIINFFSNYSYTNLFYCIFLAFRLFHFFPFFKVVLLFKYSFLPFPPTPLPNPSHPHLPALIPSGLGFGHVSFIVASENLSPYSPIIPSYFPSGYCQIVLNFNVSGYILLACFFC